MRVLAVAFCVCVAGAQTFDSYVTGNPADAKGKSSAGVLLSGGGGDVDDAFRWLVAKSGGGDIVVLRASGSDGYNKYIPTLGQVDSVQSIVTKQLEASRDPQVLEAVRNAEAIFLAGGDQWNYVRMWKGTPLEEAINTAWGKGVPVGGSSAGLAVLGEFSFSAQKDTVTSAQALANPLDERVTVESNFLKFPPLRGVITDSHFGRRDRMGRLLVFLARVWHTGRKDVRGIGIDEATTVLIEPDGSASVVGKGSAYFIKPVKISEVKAPFSGAEYDVHRVAAGSKFDLPKWRAAAGEPYRLTVTGGKISSSAAGAGIY